MSLYVVEKGHGPWEGSTVHAICSSREEAHKARVKLFEYLCSHKMMEARSKSKLKRKLYEEFFIRQVLPNTVYPFGVESNDQILIEGKVKA
jgi:hypothetical protein